jgi:transposase
MFGLTSQHRFYLYPGVTDMRKSFNGLGGLIQNELHRNATSGEVFLFVSRRRNRIKLLQGQPGGFVLYCKRLEEGIRPTNYRSSALTLSCKLPGSNSYSLLALWSAILLSTSLNHCIGSTPCILHVPRKE